MKRWRHARPPAATSAQTKLPEGSLRTCVGCRRRDAIAALARLALDEGRIVAWRSKGGGQREGAPRPPGRGASVHPDAACLRAALSSNAFARAFRGQVGQVETLNEVELLRLIAKGS